MSGGQEGKEGRTEGGGEGKGKEGEGREEWEDRTIGEWLKERREEVMEKKGRGEKAMERKSRE